MILINANMGEKFQKKRLKYSNYMRSLLFQIANETNILQDGTLIDLCGATLLWRSAEGLAKSPVSH